MSWFRTFRSNSKFKNIYQWMIHIFIITFWLLSETKNQLLCHWYVKLIKFKISFKLQNNVHSCRAVEKLHIFRISKYYFNVKKKLRHKEGFIRKMVFCCQWISFLYLKKLKVSNVHFLFKIDALDVWRDMPIIFPFTNGILFKMHFVFSGYFRDLNNTTLHCFSKCFALKALLQFHQKSRDDIIISKYDNSRLFDVWQRNNLAIKCSHS